MTIETKDMFFVRNFIIILIICVSWIPVLAGVTVVFEWINVGMFVSPVNAATIGDTKSQLESELAKIEAQIDQYSSELAVTQKQKVTLANKIKQLQNKQAMLNLQIKATFLRMTSLEDQIDDLSDKIKANILLESKFNADVAALLREMNSAEDSLLLTLLSSDGLAEMFDEVKKYSDLTSSLSSLVLQTKNIRLKLTSARASLEEKKDDAADLLKMKAGQQQVLKSTVGEQSQLLVKTKGLESVYQTMLSDSKKRAAEIRTRIYELFNVGKQINFGQAVEIAKWASGISGVRAAFLLAVLTQESNLGKNVGTCNRAGDPPEKSWKVVMKPTRDQEPFLKITKELGLDPDTTPVSCAMKDKNGNQIGWGGAMGPAQFIPSTWVGYKDKVSALSGKSPANPWDIRDAFLAAAIKLKAGGADGTATGEWNAAMRYFSGSTNSKYRFYADNVAVIAKQYEEDITEL